MALPILDHKIEPEPILFKYLGLTIDLQEIQEVCRTS